jgi:serine/threonine protein kinase
VLKTYKTSEAREDYETETKAYEMLNILQADRRQIITYYGKFTHMNTYNIIIEKADIGSLEDYFQMYEPPYLSEDIKNFWYNLFEVLNALHCIHHLGGSGSENLKGFKGFVTNSICSAGHIH